MTHQQPHKSQRTGWLRAAVLGANDGIVSTSSLVIGVASAPSDQSEILLAGIAGLCAGAMSMAAGEYVSVSSQADTEKADLEMEQQSIEDDFEAEQQELSQIYQDRGLDHKLADKVAEQLMEHDALAAHARDDIGISPTLANPAQAAVSSALCFTLGAALPLAVVILAPRNWIVPSAFLLSLLFLAGLGSIAAYLGGASVAKAAARVTFWGIAAMLATAAVGKLFGVVA